MQHLEFTKPGAPIDEYSIALDNHSTGFIKEAPNEIHQQKIATYARDDSGNIVAGILAKLTNIQCIIQGLWVSTAVRHQGVGKTLLQLLENYAKENNIRSILLETTHVELVDFYEKNAYTMLGVAEGDKANNECYALQKMLYDLVEEVS